MSKKKFKYVIIIDDKTGKPMAWSESSKQLCFCTNWEDDPHPVRFYTVHKASKLIEKTIANRGKWKMSEGSYSTLPFELKYWHEQISKRK